MTNGNHNRIKKGKHNLAKKSGQIILKKKLFFQESKNQDLHALIDSIQKDEATNRHNPRFIIVTDYKNLLAFDTKTKDTLDVEIANIAILFKLNFNFLLFIQSNLVPRAIKNKKGIKNGIIN